MKKAHVDKRLSVQSFRRTRATIMFNQRSKDGDFVFGDSHIAQCLGWEPETVALRRREYDMTTSKEPEKILFKIRNALMPMMI